MKFKVGDQVIVTTGKDKGKKSTVVAVFPKTYKVIVADVNKVVKHRKPFAGQPGEKMLIEKPLDVAKLAILNDKGEADRVGYVIDKKGQKNRVYKKTGKMVAEKAPVSK